MAAAGLIIFPVKPGSFVFVPVEFRILKACFVVRLGFRERITATNPETCGAAILVPSNAAYLPPFHGDIIETPGAAIP